MKYQKLLTNVRISFFALLITLPSACNNFAGMVRQVTYPPDFNYVSTQELRSSMQRLGFQLQQLDEALAEDSFQRIDQQQQVLGILRDIEDIGSNLRAGDAGSNHPFLQDYMSAFLVDVRQARMGASLNPPHYYMAGRVSGGCVNCHRVNR
ncbi:MAG: hypothetical protein O2971_13160 [Proteobacteria bacterium]|nr:hypothetical protein [Pseudomonadota bacterium]